MRLVERITLTVALMAAAPVLVALALFCTAIATLRALMEVWSK